MPADCSLVRQYAGRQGDGCLELADWNLARGGVTLGKSLNVFKTVTVQVFRIFNN